MQTLNPVHDLTLKLNLHRRHIRFQILHLIQYRLYQRLLAIRRAVRKTLINQTVTVYPHRVKYTINRTYAMKIIRTRHTLRSIKLRTKRINLQRIITRQLREKSIHRTTLALQRNHTRHKNTNRMSKCLTLAVVRRLLESLAITLHTKIRVLKRLVRRRHKQSIVRENILTITKTVVPISTIIARTRHQQKTTQQQY